MECQCLKELKKAGRDTCFFCLRKLKISEPFLMDLGLIAKLDG